MPDRILLPRFDTHGDIVLLEGFLEALLACCPDSVLTLLVRPGYDQLAPLFPSRLRWHTIALRPYEPLQSTDGQLERIRRYFSANEYDLVLGTCFSQTWADTAVGVLANTAARRVTLCGPGGPGPVPEEMLGFSLTEAPRAAWDKTVVADEDSGEGSKYQIMFDALMNQGIINEGGGRGRPPDPELPSPRLSIPAALEAEGIAVLQRAGLSPGSFVCCCPAGTANIGIKAWPSERFAQVIARLEQIHRLPALLIGHERERRVLESVRSHAEAHGARPRLWIGREGDLSLLAAVTSHARLYLGNDTGPMHLAAALNVPAVAVFGGGHWPRFVPPMNTVALVRELLCFRCNWDCLFADALCVKLVRTEDVIEAVDRALDQIPPDQGVSPGNGARAARPSTIIRLDTPLATEPLDQWLEKAERRAQHRAPQPPKGLLRRLLAGYGPCETRESSAMTAPVRFSIVTPSYNQAAYVGQTIESVLSQEGNFAIEYFVMDGGSRDGSVEVIRQYADRIAKGSWPVRCADLRFVWVSEADEGQANAINKGFRQATGELVSWVNSDDYYLPGAFARVADAFARHRDADFIYGDGDVVDESGKVLWEWLSRPFDLALLTSYHFLWNDFTNYILQQATFWRRSVFDRIGLLDESFHFALDVELWIRAGHAGLVMRHIAERLGAFRWVPGTKSLSSPIVFWEDYLEIFRRYRGAARLGTFLGYYYYNVARQVPAVAGQVPPPCKGDGQGKVLEAEIEAAEQRLFERWAHLSGEERSRLGEQSARGRRLCRLLLANDLLGSGASQDARRQFEAAVASRPRLVMHPFALWYLVRSAAGLRLSGWMTRLGQMAVGAYRRHRYDYRYHR